MLKNRIIYLSIIIMSVKVAVRVRPFNQREKFLGCLCCIQMKEKTTILINPRDRSQKQHQFTFDYSFWSHDGFEELQNGYLYPIDDRFVDQKRIFKQLGEQILRNAWNGFNCCLFAYGQTGAGKSYSMIGYETNRGIVPMTCQKIFEGIQRNRIKGKKQFELSISMIQIYNQKVQDLFVHTSKRPVTGLRIRESKKVGVYVEGVTRYEVHSYAEIERRMQQGAKNRSLASTLMNQYSSRAHTIVMIQFVQKQFITEQKMNKKSSMLNLVDLAGSERVAKTGISDKDRLKEASQINKSLHTLGRVIQHLADMAADKNKIIQVPYRQSALTRILETALGGNSVTTMICAVSPANDNYEQTLSTLRYADQTKRIKNKPIINESAVDKIIRELRQQNERLKQMLRIAKLKGINLQDGQNGNIFANIQQIQREIRKNMQSFAINTDGMEEQEESMTISQFIDVPDPNDFYSGELSFDAGNSTTSIGNARANAFITNLSEDRLLSFKIKYSCEQQLYVGNKNLKEGGRNKLILCGLGVEDRHARLYEINKKYYIEPLCDQAIEYTLVNGKPVDKKMEIFHNDRIIFGTNSVFLFKNFNQKGIKSPDKKRGQGIGIGVGVGGSSPGLSNSSPGKGVSTGVGVGIGVGEDLSPEKSINKSTANFGTSSKYQDLNESLLIDWEQDERPKPQIKSQKSLTPNQLSKSNSSSHSVQIQTDPIDQQIIDQKLLDYEFAINERQNKMFETSSSSISGSNSRINSSNIVSNQMNNKLEEIEREFEQLKRENERKIKQKQQQFKAQLKQMEIEKQIQKARLKEQLKIKQQEAKRINLQKQRIQKIRDKLIQIEKQRKQKQKKLKESMLLGDDSQQSQEKIQFQQVPFPEQTQQNVNYNKKKGVVSIGETNTAKGQPETKIQYVQRHHFHYEYNMVQHEGAVNPKISESINTTSATSTANLTNANVIHDESILLDQDQLKKQIEESQNIPKKPIKKQLKLESVYNLHEAPIQKQVIKEENEVKIDKKQAEQAKNQKESKTERKKSLNVTEILYDFEPTRPRRNSRKSSSGREDEQQNLLNCTQVSILASYIPSQKQLGLDKKDSQKQGFGDLSLNLSDDMTNNLAMRQQELLQKIREYEQKLKSLEQSAKQKKQSIKNIRKSFVADFGENPNSDNFYTEQQLFEGQIDFSIIQNRKNSGQFTTESTDIEKRIKVNMIQCQNENIMNDRILQVRKRKREAEELKEAFIKKQKKQLQRQLVQIIPMLQKFNLWAREMNRNLQGKVQIEYHNFTNYEIIDALKSSMKGKIRINIKIYNYEEGRSYKWPIQVFSNRFQIAQNIFERFLQNPTIDLFSDKSRDPFWDPRDFIQYAVGYLSLQPLSYALDFEGEVTLVNKGQIVGYLDVVLQPVIDRKAMKLRDKISEQAQSQNQIYDPRQLLEQDLCFTLSIQRFRPTQHLPTDKIQKFYISYQILEDNYKKQSYKTQQLNMGKKQIGYMLKHSLYNVTEHTLAYLADSPISLTLNLLFHYDEQLSNMTSSFIQSQSSLNISTLSDKAPKSQAISSESPPPFSKKKAAIIIQNPDILPKIQKQFSSEQRKIRQRAETIQNANSNSNSGNKKKEKGKQDCTVF